ncbi:MAG: hypothetical protein COA97_06865 [Flavobacteriales bacterium]|nr:MAG: hypothetical protein COA97_06865 [Flavobacteriales bacterium]
MFFERIILIVEYQYFSIVLSFQHSTLNNFNLINVFLLYEKNYFFIFLFFYFFILNTNCIGQTLYHADLYKGGVTGAGFGLDAGSNGSGVITVNIPPTSTIRKAFLISGRQGKAPDLTFFFAGNNLTFDSTKTVGTFFSSFYGDTSATHIIDVTSLINPVINSYSINISTMQQGGFNRYNEFYLYVLYEESTFPIVNSYLYINDKDFGYINYTINNISPINNLNDVGLSLFGGYICHTNIFPFDGENVYVNGNFIGLIGGNDINSGSCGGPYGDFYYENNQLFGLSDDTANAQMSGSDVLINMNSLVPLNSTGFFFRFCFTNTK